MASYIQNELDATGVAHVLVFLKDPTERATTAAATAPVPDARANALRKHFTLRETSQTSQLIEAANEGMGLRASAGKPKRTPRITAASVQHGVRYYPNLGIMLGMATKEGIAALRNEAGVHRLSGVPPISLIHPTRTAAASLTRTVTWGIEAMGVDRLWAEGITGKRIVVGHLDTGVDGKHPALKGAIKSFVEFDDLGRQVTPRPAAHDSAEHGTHTAATIAGRPVRGKHVGVAPGARLASAMVIEGGDVIARVIGGMDWALGKGVRILSMSLGLRGWHEDFLDLTNLLRAQGVLPVFAVGNEGPGTSRSPGNYPSALSIGAYQRGNSVADFSSSQRFQRAADSLVPDLVAPGVDVISAKPGGGWQSMNGSSMATPHIAGLAALLLQARPKASVDLLEKAILASCALPATMSAQRANRGVPDAAEALRLIRAA